MKLPMEHPKSENIWKDVDGRIKFASLLAQRLEILRLATQIQESHAAQQRLYEQLKKRYDLTSLDMVFVERDIEKRLQLQDETDQATFERELADDPQLANAVDEVDILSKKKR